MRIIFITLLLYLSASLSAFSDTIVLKSGTRIEGKIMERTDSYVTLDFHGIPLRYYMDNIETIYEDKKPNVYNIQKSSALDNITIKYRRTSVRVGNKCFLWEVKSGSSIVYLLGSIHVGIKSMYPLDKRIEDAFNRSDVLVVEANINKNQGLDALSLYLDYALYKDGRNLGSSLSRRTYNLAKDKLQEMGFPIDLLDMYKPWYVAVLLDNLEFVKLGYDPQYGIDSYFLNKAQGLKKILELESVKSQIRLLSSFSDKEQDLFLYYTLLYLDTMGKSMSELIDAWRNGDTKMIDSILTGEVLSSDRRLIPLFDKLIYRRNKNMADKIEDFLDTGYNYFVVVGAGHLVGAKGIVALLKKRGYFVIQL